MAETAGDAALDGQPTLGQPKADPPGLGAVAPLLVITLVQAGGVALTLIGGVIAGVRAGDDVGFILSGAGVYGLFLAGLVAVGLGLSRRSRWARGPFVVAQLFALVAAWGFGQTQMPEVGLALGLLAAAGLLLALRPATLAALQGPADG